MKQQQQQQQQQPFILYGRPLGGCRSQVGSAGGSVTNHNGAVRIGVVLAALDNTCIIARSTSEEC